METLYNDFVYDESLSRPYSAIMSLTNDCTHACPYCFVRFNKNTMEYSTAEQAAKYISANAAHWERTPTINFFGGEPLMQFHSIIKPLVTQFPDINYAITTNGALLTREVVDFFAEHQIPVLLSIDGAKHIQDTQRPMLGDQSSFDVVANNIPYAVERLGSNVMARSTITKLSLPYLTETYDTFSLLGFQRFAFAVNAFEEYTDEDVQSFYTQFHTLSERIMLNLLRRKYDMVLANLGSVAASIRNYYYADDVVDNRLERCGLAVTGCGIATDGTIKGCQEKNSSEVHTIGNVWDGIDAEKHKQLLQSWIDLKYTCPKECPALCKRMCLNDLCPSRIEDLALNGPATGNCMLNKAMFTDGMKFYQLFNNTTDEFIRLQYFNDEMGRNLCM